MESKRKFFIGHMVKWNGGYWIVENDHTDSKRKRVVHLISAEMGNTSAYVTDDWPDDKRLRVNSIEFISNTVKDFVYYRVIKW